MNLRRRPPLAAHASAAALAAALLGCATPPPARLPGAHFAGRIAVRSDAAAGHDARSVTGQFELSGTPGAGRLDVTSPLGTMVARASWDRPDARGQATQIELEAQGRSARYADFGAMTRDALGDSLPVPALFDWLAGRPWADSPAVWEPDRGAFEQLGWHVDPSRLAAEGLLAADRPQPVPALHVRVKLDAPPGSP